MQARILSFKPMEEYSNRHDTHIIMYHHVSSCLLLGACRLLLAACCLLLAAAAAAAAACCLLLAACRLLLLLLAACCLLLAACCCCCLLLAACCLLLAACCLLLAACCLLLAACCCCCLLLAACCLLLAACCLLLAACCLLLAACCLLLAACCLLLAACCCSLLLLLLLLAACCLLLLLCSRCRFTCVRSAVAVLAAPAYRPHARHPCTPTPHTATCACSPISGAHMRAARGLRDPGLCASPQGHDWVDDCAYAPPRCLAAWCTQVSCGAHLRCACVVPPPSLAGVAGDVLAVVGRVCSSPLAPSSLVRFSATCRYVRTVLRPVVEELQALHAAVRVLCTKIGMRPADLGKATELNAAFKRLDYADVAVLVTLANSGSIGGVLTWSSPSLQQSDRQRRNDRVFPLDRQWVIEGARLPLPLPQSDRRRRNDRVFPLDRQRLYGGP